MDRVRQFLGMSERRLENACIDFVYDGAAQHGLSGEDADALRKEITSIRTTLVEKGWTATQLQALAGPSPPSSSSSSSADQPLFPVCERVFGSAGVVEAALRTSAMFGTAAQSTTDTLQSRIKGELALERLVVAPFVDAVFASDKRFHVSCNVVAGGTGGKQPDLMVQYGDAKGRVVVLGEDKFSHDTKGTENDFEKCLTLGRKMLLDKWESNVDNGWMWLKDKFPLFIVLFTGGRFVVLLMTMKNPLPIETYLQQGGQKKRKHDEVQKQEVAQEEEEEEEEKTVVAVAAQKLVPELNDELVEVVRREVEGCDKIPADHLRWVDILPRAPRAALFSLIYRLPKCEFATFAKQVLGKYLADKNTPAIQFLLQTYVDCAKSEEWHLLVKPLVEHGLVSDCVVLERLVPHCLTVVNKVKLTAREQIDFLVGALTGVQLHDLVSSMSLSADKKGKVLKLLGEGVPKRNMNARLQRVLEGHVGNMDDAVKLLMVMANIVEHVRECAEFKDKIPSDLRETFKSCREQTVRGFDSKSASRSPEARQPSQEPSASEPAPKRPKRVCFSLPGDDDD